MGCCGGGPEEQHLPLNRWLLGLAAGWLLLDLGGKGVRKRRPVSIFLGLAGVEGRPQALGLERAIQQPVQDPHFTGGR